MKRRILLPLSVVAVLAVIVLGSGTFRRPAGEVSETVDVKAEPFEVWSVYEGTIEARLVKSVTSKSRGSATIEEIVPQGVAVKEGDILVRFDASDAEDSVLQLERDYALAKAELQSLQKAKLPLEIQDLETRLMEARVQMEAEAQYLVDTRELFREDLVSEQELSQQETKSEAAATLATNLETQLELTRDYLHPATLERARATLEAADERLRIAKEKLENRVVTSPSDGQVVYRPVYVSGERRTVRVGDTIYRNQAFIILPDMSDPLVQCHVPEAELSRVNVGSRAVVTPVAYPDLQLTGEVESVGSMAENVSGRPNWQKYFLVTLKLTETDARLRAGMTVRASILSYESPDALLIPRAAVRWEAAKPYCIVRGGLKESRRDLILGISNDRSVEVLEGLQEGEKVVR